MSGGTSAGLGMSAPVDDAVLVADLSAARHLPTRALALALERPEAVAGPVLSALAGAADGADLDDEQADLLFWGLHVLAHARDGRALAPLLRLLRQDGETIDALLGDAVATTLSKVVASLFDGPPQPLFRLILDSTVDDEVRNALLAACVTLVRQGRVERQALHDVLVRFDEAAAAVEEGPAWIGWEETIGVLGFADLAPRVERARRDGRLSGELSDPAWFRDTLRRACGRPDDPNLFPPAHYGTLDDPIGDLAWTREGAGMPERNPLRDVGRNDPCPCGSGRKFKKCCLGKDVGAGGP